MRKVKIVGISLEVIGIIWGYVFLKLDSPIALLGLASCLTGLIYFLVKWRCPYCRTPLPTSGMLGITVCPYCGNELDD